MKKAATVTASEWQNEKDNVRTKCNIVIFHSFKQTIGVLQLPDVRVQCQNVFFL